MLCWFWGPHLSYHSNYGNPSKGLSSPASSQVYISSWHGMDMFNNKNSTGRTTWSYKNGNQLLFYINLSKILSIVNHHVDTKLITERPLNRDNCHPPVFPALHVWPAQEPEVLLLVCLPAHTHQRPDLERKPAEVPVTLVDAVSAHTNSQSGRQALSSCTKMHVLASAACKRNLEEQL